LRNRNSTFRSTETKNNSKSNLDQFNSERDLFDDKSEITQDNLNSGPVLPTSSRLKRLSDPYHTRFKKMSGNTGYKKAEGESPVGSPEPFGGNSSGGSTTMGMSLSKLKRVEGNPTLVRINPNDKNKTLDFWNNTFSGSDSSRLEVILSLSVTDPFYSMSSFITAIEYQGFDRLLYIKHCLTVMSVSVFSRFAIIGALRGSNFRKICDTCESMPQDLISAHDQLGFVKTPKKRKDITILRNTASIPHWCSHWLLEAGISKKISQSSCHAALQFPGAASLPMSKSVRLDHVKFCAEFSKLLPGGLFNTNIYLTAMNNPIPLSDIPATVLSILEVKSQSESYALTEVDLEPYDNSRSLVKK
jgi:hypothetical protein